MFHMYILLTVEEDVQEENQKNAPMERKENQNQDVQREVPRNARPKDALMEKENQDAQEENPDVPRNAPPDVVIKHSFAISHKSYENMLRHHAFFYFEYPNLNSKHQHGLEYMSFSNYIST